MRGEAAPYSLVPSSESSLLEEREGGEKGGGGGKLKHVKTIFTDNNNTKDAKKRR